MISQADFTAFLVISLVVVVLLFIKLDKILDELKALREKIDRK
jgi:hypothetical protein